MLDNAVTASGRGRVETQTVTAEAKASVEVEPDPTTVHLVKTAQPRDVKIGDLVRYTLTMENTGEVAVVDATLVDTPPAGFTYVDGTLTVADDDGAGRLVGTYPISVDQIDIAVGGRATITYLLRVGAGVRAGTHTNTAQVLDNGAPVSNIATADVQLVSDPMLDESLIVGTVFDDRDGDGWQDSAAMGGIRVQGGFAPGAYVAGSTTVDRGKGPQPEADASAPLLHGIAIGDIAGRQSDADPAAAHRVVVGQTLSSLDFTDDFVLTTKRGVSLRMDAAGNTSVDRSQGDAGAVSARPRRRWNARSLAGRGRLSRRLCHRQRRRGRTRHSRCAHRLGRRPADGNRPVRSLPRDRHRRRALGTRPQLHPQGRSGHAAAGQHLHHRQPAAAPDHARPAGALRLRHQAAAGSGGRRPQKKSRCRSARCCSTPRAPNCARNTCR